MTLHRVCMRTPQEMFCTEEDTEPSWIWQFIKLRRQDNRVTKIKTFGSSWTQGQIAMDRILLAPRPTREETY